MQESVSCLLVDKDDRKGKVTVSLSFPSCQEAMFGLCLGEHEEE